jgi:hypothetical protein
MKNEETEYVPDASEDYDPVFDANEVPSQEEFEETFKSYSTAKKMKILEESSRSGRVIQDYKTFGSKVPPRALSKLPKELEDPRIKKITDWIDSNYKKGTKIDKL